MIVLLYLILIKYEINLISKFISGFVSSMYTGIYVNDVLITVVVLYKVEPTKDTLDDQINLDITVKLKQNIFRDRPIELFEIKSSRNDRDDNFVELGINDSTSI
jgi:hypothetical protein